MPVVVPDSKRVLSKGLVELGALTLISAPMLYFHILSPNYPPFVRGFYCDDQNLKHPYKEVRTEHEIRYEIHLL